MRLPCLQERDLTGVLPRGDKVALQVRKSGPYSRSPYGEPLLQLYADKCSLLQLLRELLRFDPEDRISAADAVRNQRDGATLSSLPVCHLFGWGKSPGQHLPCSKHGLCPCNTMAPAHLPTLARITSGGCGGTGPPPRSTAMAAITSD